MKILISGGHLTPALALIDYVLDQTQDEVVFVGRIFSQKKHQQLAHEKDLVEKRGVKFIPFESSKLEVKTGKKLAAFSQIFLSLKQAKQIFAAEKPTVFLSFGGYLAVPLAIAAKLAGVPIVTHEQTRAAGAANQFIALLANKIALADSCSCKYFPAGKTVVTGNPLRSALTQTGYQPSWLKHRSPQPLLLVLGGNQGSAAINQAIKQALPELVKNWQLVHLCGNSTPTLNYLAELTQAQQKLPAKWQKNYLVREWVDGPELAWLYDQAQAAVSRAGANTVMELTYKQIPAVFIPLPHARHDEQQQNITHLIDQSASLVLAQADLTPTSLLEKLHQLQSNLKVYQQNLAKFKIDTQATQQLYQLLTNELKV